jgi:hypothetical protein
VVQINTPGGITSAVEKIARELVDSALLSYLRAGDYPMGFLLNFNTVHMRDGMKRVVNRL